MINRAALLSDLQKLLQRLEADLLERSESVEVPEVGKALRAEYDRARTAERTAQNYEDWRTDFITQAAAAWVLSCVFVRFLEDNRLIDPPKIAGPDDRLQRARDEHELYFRNSPKHTDRDYLLAVFDQLAKLPGTKDVFGEHNPIRELPNWLSGDAAGELLRFFQKIDANTGTLIHDFSDTNWDTRFLGDLYQDLSEAARKKYALLQTPEFVEEFILDRTLEPALEEFGLEMPAKGGTTSATDKGQGTRDNFKMIDPACGSGHFLLGAFPRILDRWQRKEPGTNVRELVQRTLDSIHGVDINPYAVGIARFRLLLAAMRACAVTRLADAPGFRMHLACGDSLLHAPLRASQTESQNVFDFELTSTPGKNDDSECEHAYHSEDLPVLKHILRGGHYHAVVANPPYITPKDRQLNERYRKRFSSCHMKYSLAVPFLERIFKLAIPGGYTGQITANSFMKREFGKKLIESFFPTVDLTHVLDTSGAYIPGHGTPTVILFGRHRSPMASALRAVMGIRGEPVTPDDPARGLVWSAIVAQLDQPGTQCEFVSVADSPRELFLKHPWSIGGGGAAELKEQLEERAAELLDAKSTSIGFASFSGQDEAFVSSSAGLRRSRLPHDYIKEFVVGDTVRDWEVTTNEFAFAPYNSTFVPIDLIADAPWARWLWPMRAVIGSVISFGGKTRLECGDKWWTWYRWVPDKYRVPMSIVFSEVATHNHFVLDRGGKVFKQTAPVIKLPPDATEDDHLALLGLLNSSTACFWMKQVAHNKGDSTDEYGARTIGDPAFNTYAFNGTLVGKLPLSANRPLKVARIIDQLAQKRQRLLPAHVLRSNVPSRESLATASSGTVKTLGRMIAAQEELDWECYRLYGLIADDLTLREPPPLNLGQRAFEIVLARKMAAGKTQTTWFERRGSTPITELPTDWPDDYRQLVERRIALIESDPNIRLIEQPEYKRRWNTEPWESQLERALREWLLDRLEGYFDFDGRMRHNSPRRHGDHGEKAEHEFSVSSVAPWCPLSEIQLVSFAKLADVARQDAEFQQVGELYRDDPAFDVQALVTELVAAECVPLLPVLRYKPSGLIKRGTWERTWDLQRQEDAIDDRTNLPSTDPKHLSADAARDLKQQQVGNIPVPTKYDSKDFLDSNFWRQRGKLDVPKERWISFPHCEGPDGTPVIAWAGYDHLQQARAISAYYVRVQTEFGGSDDARLIPLLACLIELLPWLKQWHNDPDPAFDGMRMGDYFEGFVNEEARQLNKTIPEIKAWTPPARTGGRGRRKS